MLSGIMMILSGKRYGNKVADFLEIRRGLFHTAMEDGGCHMHLLVLHALKQDETEIKEVAWLCSQYLIRGIDKFNIRFGYPEVSKIALKKVTAFMNDYENALNELEQRADATSARTLEQKANIVDSTQVHESGRYELKYKTEIVERIRGKEILSTELIVRRSDDLNSLKAIALVRNLQGQEFDLKDLSTGNIIPIDSFLDFT